MVVLTLGLKCLQKVCIALNIDCMLKGLQNSFPKLQAGIEMDWSTERISLSRLYYCCK